MVRKKAASKKKSADPKKKRPTPRKKVAAKKAAVKKAAAPAPVNMNFEFYETPDPQNARAKIVGLKVQGDQFPAGFRGMDIVINGGTPRDRRRMQQTLGRLLAAEYRSA